MAANDILTLNKPMAPRLIQILYWIALLAITLGVVLGVVGGVRTMTRPLSQPAAAGAPADQSAPPQIGQMMHQPGPGFGPERFRRGFGPRHMRHGPEMFGMRGLSPTERGALRIIMALVHGLIILLVVRILAEIGIAILTKDTKPEAQRV